MNNNNWFDLTCEADHKELVMRMSRKLGIGIDNQGTYVVCIDESKEEEMTKKWYVKVNYFELLEWGWKKGIFEGYKVVDEKVDGVSYEELFEEVLED